MLRAAMFNFSDIKNKTINQRIILQYASSRLFTNWKWLL